MTKIVILWKFFFLVLGCLSFTLSMIFLKTGILFEWSVGLLKNFFKFSMKIKIDWMSLLFFGILLMIVFSVKKFSFFYLKDDVFFLRFFWLLMGFVVSMVFLMFMPSIVFLLVGWDGLGFTSFLLIVYYKTSKAWSSGLKTYLINRMGDAFLILSFVNLFKQGLWKSLFFDSFLVSSGCVLFVVGCFTKSAQFPFCSWLPAAMAAPTPVSALVHSSTLVTAGIYLLIRFGIVLDLIKNYFMAFVSIFTLFLASFSACVEWDLKKIIAFSTLSQLGLMCFSISCGLMLYSFFHLITHAVFKAMLFIGAGYLIGQTFHLQDLRSLNCVGGYKPFVCFSLMLSILALSGFPFMSGFFSKDIMIEGKLFIFNYFFLSLFYMSLSLTVFYSLRLLFFLLWGNTLNKNCFLDLKTTSMFSVGVLMISSLCLGSLVKNIFNNFFMISFSGKMLVFFLIFFGVVIFFGLKQTELKLNKKWLKSKIFFLESSKIFFTKKMSFFGSLVFFFDQSLGVTTKKNMKTFTGILGNQLKMLKNFFENFNLQIMFVLIMSLIFFLILI